MADRIEAKQRLKGLFGLEGFHDRQWQVIEHLLAGKRVLLVERTGFGKSLCFQFPATQLGGITIVFSPLIALIQEQVDKLERLGIKAGCLHSEQVPYLNELTLREAKAGRLKLLYIAPERLHNPQWFKTLMRMDVSMVVIDEAHCISMWGHDFRPAFRGIVQLLEQLPAPCAVLATTATATQEVETDIVRQMGRGITEIVRGPMYRSNIRLQVQHMDSEEHKLAWLADFMQTAQGTGLVYSGTRGDVERIAGWLQFIGISCAAYHAGMDSAARRAIEAGLMNNAYRCVVATNALGMGIDKPDIRFIVHTQIPVTPIHYYQETGRAGRDGKPADAILLFNPKDDLELPMAMIASGKPPLAKYKALLSFLQQQPAGMLAIQRKLNLRQLQFRVLIMDLEEQGIIREAVKDKIKYYELVPKAPQLDETTIVMARQLKEAGFAEMMAYTELKAGRMVFLCRYLGEPAPEGHSEPADEDCVRYAHGGGDTIDQWKGDLEAFGRERFPTIDGWPDLPGVSRGVAAAWYHLGGVRESVRWMAQNRHKEIPDYLFRSLLRAYRSAYRSRKFDVVTYVPSIQPNYGLKHAATRLGKLKDLSFKEPLAKIKQNHPQRDFNSTVLRRENVRRVFTMRPDQSVNGASVLLIDDLFDSGETLREASRVLLHAGAEEVCLLVVAKTNGLME